MFAKIKAINQTPALFNDNARMGGNMIRFFCAALLALAFIFTVPAGARADVASAYKGKTLTVYGPFSARGGYGALTRVLAANIGRHIPGQPRAIAKYMPGAGGLKQTNHIYNVAPKNGLHIGLMYDGIPTAQVLHPNTGVKYDARKFGVLGSINKGQFGIMVAFKSTGVKTLADAKRIQVITGSTGTASAPHYVPEIMNSVLGTRFKQIPGYKGTGQIFLAMERGELTGMYGNYDTLAKRRPQWFKDKSLTFLAQLGAGRDPLLPNVPTMQELATDSTDKAMFKLLAQSRIVGKIFITPPGIPADRLAALRKAFAATMKDKAFKKVIKKIKKVVDPRSWQESAALIAATLDASPEVVTRVRKFVKPRKRKKKKKKKKTN